MMLRPSTLSVAYVVNMFPKVSETFITSEIGELTRRGVSCRVLSLKAATEPVRHPIVAELGLDRLVSYDRAEFVESLRRDPPDFIHAHFATEPTRVARELSTQLDVPFSCTTHAYDIYRKAPADLSERLRAAASVVTVSEANADHMVSQFGATRDHLHVIPCGVDVGRFRPDPSRLEPATIVCVARLRPVKDVAMLLRACRRLSDRAVPYRLIVIGDGPIRAELEAERSALGLDDVVAFEGAQDQGHVLSWWQRATVGALTSRSEGMPVSLMEAAICGVPVVATRVGGVAELIEHGVTGFVVEPFDDEATARSLERILTDSSLREAMSEAARRRGLVRFSLTRQIDDLLTVWDEMLRREGRVPERQAAMGAA
jgi:colanic acid/amylovoran biosynthesis glycosyltransferase